MRRLLALVALALLASACGSAAEPESAATVAASGGDTEIAGETLDGKRLSLADFRGEPVFVNVWSSW
jgi:ABC-type glycerol-3-phosphate transport system substrate-binding protein